MITTLLNLYQKINFSINFKPLFLTLLGLLVIAYAASAQDIRSALPNQTIVCAGTTGITLEAAADHPTKTLVAQWQILQNGTWTNITGSAINTSFSKIGNREVTTTKLQVSTYTNAQQYRVAFGVNSVNPETANAITATTIIIPAASFTSPITDLYSNEPAAFSFSGITSSNATYTWSFAPAANFTSGSTSQSKNPVVTWNTPGEKKVTLTVNDGSCTVTATQIIKVYGDYTWTGGANTDWFNAANWSVNAVPGAKDNVIIVAAPFQSELSANTGIRNLTVQSGNLNLGTATLTVNGNATVNNGIINGSAVIFNGNLEVNHPDAIKTNSVVFSGNMSQTIKNNGAAGLTFTNLTIDKTENRVSLATSVTVNGALDLKNSNKLQLANADLQLGASGQILAGNAGYVVTNGTGTLQMVVANDNIEVFFPVGNHSYNPVKIKQTTAGTSDIFKVRVQGGLYDMYGTDDNGVEQPAIDGISRTWVIKEAVEGGSNAQVTLQFSSNNAYNDWMPDFSLSKAVLAQYSDSWTTAVNSKPMPVVTNEKMLQITQTNITSFRLFGVFNNDHKGLSTLPVELLNFSAARQNSGVALKWSTATEQNNDYFTVEQSVDGYTFKPVGQLKGAGNSTHKIDYNYLHRNAPVGLTYYRLKQTDFDGSTSYSRIVAVEEEKGATATISVYPNPGTGLYKLAGVEDLLDATVVDATGRTVKRLTTLDKEYTFDLSDQQAGVYFLRLNSGTQVKTLRLIKK